MSLEFKKVTKNLYRAESEDGRNFEIHRFNYKGEESWFVFVNGTRLFREFTSKEEAEKGAERKLGEKV